MNFSDTQYILFLNTVLAFCCSSVILIGLWPFQGLFHSWLFKNSRYTWTTHVEMAWFDVGCIGLFTINLQALIKYSEETSTEAYHTVFITNAVMHGLWGFHNLHQFIRYLRKQGKGTVNELRRPYPLMFYSIIGACGSAAVRNVYASVVSMEDYSIELIVFTWVWEWVSLMMVLLDFGYHLVKECKWGGNVASDEEIMYGNKVQDTNGVSTTSPTTTIPSV